MGAATIPVTIRVASVTRTEGHVPGSKHLPYDEDSVRWCGQPGTVCRQAFLNTGVLETRELIQERTREINRVQMVLEDANIKLGSVASNVLGVSGREMIEQLIAGQEDPAQLAQLARGRLREKITELEKALKGKPREAHRLLLKLHLEHIDDLNAKIATLSEEIDRLLVPFDPNNALERLDTIPGVNRQIAEVILACLSHNPSPIFLPQGIVVRVEWHG
jgi:transposase